MKDNNSVWFHLAAAGAAYAIGILACLAIVHFVIGGEPNPGLFIGALGGPAFYLYRNCGE